MCILASALHMNETPPAEWMQHAANMVPCCVHAAPSQRDQRMFCSTQLQQRLRHTCSTQLECTCGMDAVRSWRSACSPQTGAPAQGSD